MALAPGTQLGPYDVVSLLGEGGMGQVYRARDTRLKRDVALKILPDAFAADPNRVARFQREAELLATLNHPNIAGIYGLEHADGTRALVLELVEGPTLADRIAAGPIPVDEALPIARQIADALEAAHERGVIHRDLKPANIKLTSDGKVKVLDFGLAKAMDPVGEMSTQMTDPGTIMGTAAYMAPEQARGQSADKRSDVWAFGCVLYEVLTARRPFEGRDFAETLANVLKTDPDWTALPADLPPPIRTLVQSCLKKDRKQRIGDMSTALFLLTERHVDGTPPAAVSRPRWRTVSTLAGAVLLAAIISGTGMWFALRPAPAHVSVLSIATDAAHALTMDANSRPMAISPDGRRIAYVGPNGSLLLRSLDQLEPTVLTQASSTQIGSPAFSPDGQWVGYFEANNRLFKVQASGGPSVQIAGLDGGNQAGMTWLPDGTVVFATQNRVNGLLQTIPGVVPGYGVRAWKVLTTPNRQAGEADHLWPEALPGGRGVLFTILPASLVPGDAQTAVFDLRTGKYKTIVPGATDAHYVAGHLVYSVGGALRATAFDLDRLEPFGGSTPLGISVLTTAEMAAAFDVSPDGTLVYVPGAAIGRAERELTWVGRDGREQPLGAPPRQYLYPRLSPDGKRVLLDVRDQDNDLWLWDIARATLTNLTRNPALDRYPVWIPDGKSFVFSSERGGQSALYRQAVDGNGDAERLTTPTQGQQAPTGVSPDGRYVLFDLLNRQLNLLTLDGEHRVSALPNTGEGLRPVLSADGQWLAYESRRSGRYEIYLQPFPVSTGWKQVSIDGGVQPLWSRTGHELFYFTLGGSLMSVQVKSLAELSRPAVVLEAGPWLFQPNGTGAANYDVAADGRLLMIKEPRQLQATAPQLVVVQNWLETLKRLVSSK